MKIMIITTPQEFGGGETYVKNLVNGLPQHDFLVLTSLRQLNNQLNSKNARSHIIYINIKFLSKLNIILFLILLPLNIIQYLYFLLRFNPNIVHIQSREEQILVTPIARLLGKKVIWTLHGPTEKGNKVVDFMLLKSSLMVDKVIAVSNFIKESMRSYGIKSPTVVIYHGIDLKRFRPTISKRSLQTIGFIGRLVKVKRPQIFLDTSIELVRRLPQLQIWIVGEGNLKIEMEIRVATFPRRSRIKFFGFRRDIENIIRNFTILLITSETEGLDISALEAIASGVPVVAVNVGALSEVVNNKTGVLINSDNPKIIAASILSLIQDGKLLAKLKKTTRESAEKRFSLERMLIETDLVYRG